MSDLKREERYIVVKVKDMDNITEDALRKFLFEREIQAVGCVVTEEDWPNYEHVWQTIEQVANGTFDPDEITRLQAENEALRARVAELSEALQVAVDTPELQGGTWYYMAVSALAEQTGGEK